MDCRVYLSDGRTPVVQGVKTIKPVFKNNSENRITLVLYNTNDENPNPIATFYDVVGYETIGARE